MSNKEGFSMNRNTAIIALLTGGVLTILGAGVAHADPIVCPPGQTSVQVAPSQWQCVNNGDNVSNAEDPRSPQADKGTF